MLHCTHLGCEAVSRGFPLAPAPGEESAFVLQPLRLDNKRAFQFGLNESHNDVSCKQLARSEVREFRRTLTVVNPERFFDSKRPPHIR